jgi:hypothetical protein
MAWFGTAISSGKCEKFARAPSLVLQSVYLMAKIRNDSGGHKVRNVGSISLSKHRESGHAPTHPIIKAELVRLKNTLSSTKRRLPMFDSVREAMKSR